MSKKVFTFIFILLLATSFILVSCAEDKEPVNQEEESKQTQGTTEGTEDKDSKNEVQDEKPLMSTDVDYTIEFSYLAPIFGPATVETESNFSKELFKRANVKIEGTFIPFLEYDQKFTTMVMGGSGPDMYWVNPPSTTITNDLISQGALLPLDDLLDKYPDIKASFPDFVWDQTRGPDGKIYGIPAQAVLPYVPFPILVRKDLYDKHDIPLPKTMDELGQTIKIIQDKEGEEMYGLTVDFYDLWAFQNFGPAFGYGFHCWEPAIGEDPNNPSKIVPSFMTEGFREFLKYLNNLRKIGVLDPDMGIVKNIGGTDKFYQGKCVAFSGGGAYFDTVGVFSTLKKNVPEAEIAFVDGLEGSNGRLGCCVLQAVMKMVSISANAKNPDDIFKFLNWHASEEGYKLMQHGVRNKMYYEFLNEDNESIIVPITENDPDYEEGWDELSKKIWCVFTKWEDTAEVDWKEDYIGIVRQTRTIPIPDSEAVGIAEMRKNMFRTAVEYAYPDYKKGTFSPTLTEKGAFLEQEHILPVRDKLLIADNPDWTELDKAIEEWLANGGQQIVDEVNNTLSDKSRPENPSFPEKDFTDYGSISDKDINPKAYYEPLE